LSGAKAGECLLSINGNYSDGKFYFVDKFISLVNGNEICLFRYKLRDPFFKDDVKRLQAKCQFKQVLKLKQENAQSITRTACHNSFYSHLILAAGSNKVVSVWDVDKQLEICTIPTVHRKMIHNLRFFSSSDYSEADSESFNLFLTCSSDNFVRLFDLRVADDPLVFVGHTNTALELGASISPCRNYIASGSEDRSAYVWDLRTTKVLSRLKGFRDVTNDVAWNPLFQQVCVAGNDGRIKFFS
jgi:WD40 repeat protein